LNAELVIHTAHEDSQASIQRLAAFVEERLLAR
jgi:hypothetical protein